MIGFPIALFAVILFQHVRPFFGPIDRTATTVRFKLLIDFAMRSRGAILVLMIIMHHKEFFNGIDTAAGIATDPLAMMYLLENY